MSKNSATIHGLGTSPQQTNKMLIRRMLALAWKYRWGCIGLLTVNIILLALSILGLSLMGVGVDFIRYELITDKTQTLVMADSSPHPDSAISVAPKPPHWPLGIRPPAHWTRYQVLLALAFGIVVLAIARALLNFSNVILANRLTQAQIVVNLRAQVFAKMQELSFRFFDANTSGSLINRVTGDVQAVRQFIDGVVIQVITLVISLAIFFIYMIHIHPSLTAACLVSTPLIWFVSAKFSNAIKPSYKKNRDLFDRLILALSENVQGAHVVKGFARQKEQIAQFDAMNDQFRDQQFGIFSKISTFHPMITMLTNVNIMIMLAYGGYLVVQHERATD
ncbi:MAG: ABC transporter ATP-binding protein, partial [bacterium]